jgi:hypothetical protein
MAISQALEISMKARRMKLKDLDLPYSQSMKSMIKTGQRPIAHDVMPKLVEQVRHPATVFAAANEVTGGFGPVWLDGPNVDLHRASVTAKTKEEAVEALDALDNFQVYKPPETLTESDRKKLKSLLMELFDAGQAIYQLIAVFCEDYGLDMLDLGREHRAKLRNLRYVTE